MCGIIGILSKSAVAGRILEGLKRIEYRGYDSAGIALTDKGSIVSLRAAGKLDMLEKKMRKASLLGFSGLGHTRWATHGAATDENAHPHVVDAVAIVHNGIIDNYLELQESLTDKGVEMSSQTDSEIIAHCIADIRNSNLSPIECLTELTGKLSGAFAFMAIDAKQEDQLMFARNGSPLAIGLADNGDVVFGSDAQTVAPWCRKVIFLEDGDYGVASLDKITIHDKEHKPCKRDAHIIDSALASGKGRHRHFMHKEIFEQPTVIAHTFLPLISTDTSNSKGKGKSKSKHQSLQLPDALDWENIDRIFMTACGTAYYACMVARNWFEGLAKLPVDLELASELKSRQIITSGDSLAILVSQSGETKDTLDGMKLLKGAGFSTLGLVNVASSALARECDISFLTHAGPEIGVASTKAFTTQLTALLCLALVAARKRGVMTSAKQEEHLASIRSLPALITEVIHREQSEYVALGEELAKSDYCMFMGRGALYPLALEGALKLKEISYIPCEGYAAGEMKHGPIALIQNDVPVIILLPGELELQTKILHNAATAAARGAKLVIVGDDSGIAHANKKLKVWKSLLVPSCSEIVQPIVYAVAVQLIAYNCAFAKGTDIDQPRNLAKSVTVE